MAKEQPFKPFPLLLSEEDKTKVNIGIEALAKIREFSLKTENVLFSPSGVANSPAVDAFLDVVVQAVAVGIKLKAFSQSNELQNIVNISPEKIKLINFDTRLSIDALHKAREKLNSISL